MEDKLCLDGVVFPKFDIVNVPRGFVDVDVKIIDNGIKFDAIMIAGSLGGKIVKNSDGTIDSKEIKLGVGPG